MSRKKKRNENSSSEQGLHLKSTPKGNSVPQSYPHVTSSRYKPRRKYWRRRYSRSWKRRRSPLGIVIVLFVMLFLLLCAGIDKLWTLGANHFGKKEQESRQENIVSSNLTEKNSPPPVVKTIPKTTKKSQKKHKSEIEKKALEDNQLAADVQNQQADKMVDNSDEQRESEDSALFDELFNKALTGTGQTRQSKQPHYQPPKITKQFVPQASWSPGNLESHWAKHGMEFPEYHNATEYGNGALYFFARPPPGTLRKVRENGDRLYYHVNSNTFGVTTADGTPKTMFRPTRGIEYWEQQ